jgi:hypothetical protein
VKAKLVSESLDKYSFEKKSNPLDSLNIGQRSMIIGRLHEMMISDADYVINDDYSINVNNGVDLEYTNLTKFPDYIQFYKVYYNFDYRNNKLISLRGCPVIVTNNFYCHGNNLINLKNSPDYVGGGFSCSNNEIVSLEGCPYEVNGNFYCDNNIKQFTIADVKKVCKVKGNVYV